MRARIIGLDPPDHPGNQQILAFLRTQMARAHGQAGSPTQAASLFQQAIDTDATAAPAYISLGDLRAANHDLPGAIAIWEQLTRSVPDRAHLVLGRLERAYAPGDAPARFAALCQRLIAQQPQDWRTRLALARHLSDGGQQGAALDLLFDALPRHPHALAIHQDIWRVLSLLEFNPVLVGRYTDLTKSAVFYLDPHVCTTCRYRSTELLWQCPQCHDWNTFIEDRMASARELTTSSMAES